MLDVSVANLGTPKFRGTYRRCTSKFGEMSGFHIACAMALVVAALAVFLRVAVLMVKAHL